MKTSVENVDATTAILTVEVPAADLKPAMDHAYKDIAAQIQVPGFRKGKVPSRIIDQRVGKATVVEHAVNDAIPGFYRDAIAAESLRPLGQPSIEVTELPDPASWEGNLVFTANLEVRPPVEVPSVDGLTLEVDALEVSDDDVQSSLDALRERFGTLVGVDRPAAEGDFVVIDMVATVDGEQVDTLSGQSYQIGSGTMLEGLDEALAGLSAGETTTFSSPLAGGEHAGKEAEITVTASAVKERELPEADDDFAQLASEFDTIEELRDDLRTNAAAGRKGQLAVQARDKLIDHLVEAVEVPVPKGVLEAEVNDHLEREGRLEDDEHRAEVVTDTTRALKMQILLDTIAEAQNVQVGQEELLEYMVQNSRRYGMDPNEFIQAMADRGQIAGVVAEIARGKGIAALLRQVKVVDPSGAAVDISEFLGPAPAEQPESIELSDGVVSAESAESADSAGSADSAPSAESAPSAPSPEEPAEASASGTAASPAKKKRTAKK